MQERDCRAEVLSHEFRGYIHRYHWSISEISGYLLVVFQNF